MKLKLTEEETEKSSNQSIISEDYFSTLKEIKEKVRISQIKAALAVNKELIALYWEIGRSIYRKQGEEGWGAKTIEKLAKDLRSAFPDMKGFSFRNVKYMVQLAKEYPDFEIRQQPVAQIPWGHNLLLLQKLKSKEQRIWYANKIIENGWSRSVLSNWIESDLYTRQGKAITNFPSTLPPMQSDLAHQTLKDPYCFDFLILGEDANERSIESGLISHIQKFLLELGKGFAFVGSQYLIEVDDDSYYIDLLFYHLTLRSFIVLEIKNTKFHPRDIGQLNFYLSAVDDLLRHKTDNPSIGLILCKEKTKTKAEYALRDINKPIGVASFETEIINSLPKNLKSSLPTVEEIEAEINRSQYEK